jgi:hypothetical protein
MPLKQVIKVNMTTNTFIVKLSDDKQRRIPIDKAIWELQGLKKGDYVKVTIEKIKV